MIWYLTIELSHPSLSAALAMSFKYGVGVIARWRSFSLANVLSSSRICFAQLSHCVKNFNQRMAESVFAMYPVISGLHFIVQNLHLLRQCLSYKRRCVQQIRASLLPSIYKPHSPGCNFPILAHCISICYPDFEAQSVEWAGGRFGKRRLSRTCKV